MGAVFAFFSGFYYWYKRLFSRRLNEANGTVHFWITFLGVNLTFFPMHFLGLAGMPRRIPDYPDAYYQFNNVATWGSLITVAGIVWFFVVIYYSFKRSSRYVRFVNNWRFELSVAGGVDEKELAKAGIPLYVMLQLLTVLLPLSSPMVDRFDKLERLRRMSRKGAIVVSSEFDEVLVSYESDGTVVLDFEYEQE